VLFDWYVEEQKIITTKAPEQGSDVNGKKFSYSLAQIKNLRVGVTVKNADSLPVVPSLGLIKQLRIAGILSPQRFFVANPFLINFEKLELESSKDINTSGYEILVKVKIRPCSAEKPNKLVIPAKVCTISGEFYIDTGASSPTLKKKYASDELIKRGSRSSSPGVTSKAHDIIIPNLPVSIGDVTANLAVDLTDSNACENSYRRIGNGFWLQYALLFAATRANLTFFRKIQR